MMMKLLTKFTITLLIGAMTIWVTPVIAQQTLTLDQAIKLALKNNTEMKTAEMDVTAADAAIDEAYGYAYPKVDFSSNLTHMYEKPKIPFVDFNAMLSNATNGILEHHGLIGPSDWQELPMEPKLMSMSQANSYEAQIQVTQILFNSAVFRGIGASQVYKDLSVNTLENTKSHLILDVTKAFYGVLLIKEQLKIANESLEFGQQNLKNVRALNQQGLASDFDLMRVEVWVENIKPQISMLQTYLISALEGFKFTMGVDPAMELDVEGTFEIEKIDMNTENYIKQAFASNMDLQMLDKTVELSEVMIDVEKADYWPTVAAFGSYARAGTADDLNFMNYATGAFGLSFSINLFSGMQTSNRVQQAQIDYDKTKLVRNNVKNGIVTLIRSKMAEIETILSNLEAQDRNVKLALKTRELADVRYKEGKGNQLEIQDAELQLKQAKTNKLQSIHDYIVAVSELKQLIGK